MPFFKIEKLVTRLMAFIRSANSDLGGHRSILPGGELPVTS